MTRNDRKDAADLLDLIAKKYKRTGMQARLLLLAAMAAASHFDPPKEKWSSKETRNPESFIKDVWGEAIRKYEVTTATIRGADFPLYVAWNNWKRYNKSTLRIPKKCEVNDIIGQQIEQTVEKEFNAFRSRKNYRAKKTSFRAHTP